MIAQSSKQKRYRMENFYLQFPKIYLCINIQTLDNALESCLDSRASFSLTWHIFENRTNCFGYVYCLIIGCLYTFELNIYFTANSNPSFSGLFRKATKNLYFKSPLTAANYKCTRLQKKNFLWEKKIWEFFHKCWEDEKWRAFKKVAGMLQASRQVESASIPVFTIR